MGGPGRPSLGERAPFALRLDKKVMDAVKKSAEIDMRGSLNAQIEVLLREALRRRGLLRDDPAEMP